jgi:calcium-dependent protein kinase
VYGDLAEEYVDGIMKAADMDGNGELEYSEWVVATINKESLLTEDKLRTAFDMFDRDGGGSINA